MKNEFSDRTRVIVSIMIALLSTITNACIQFILSPYIVRTIGVEAQGFVQLGSNFISYIALTTIALNSMSARFITIAKHKNDSVSMGKYYSSVFLSDVIVLMMLMIPEILCVVNLERIIDIPSTLVWDVKVLFTIVFLNFAITTLLSLWNNVFYICDRMYLGSIGTMIQYFLNAGIVFVLYTMLKPHLWYAAFAVLLVTPFSAYWGMLHMKKFLPQLKVKRSMFSLKHLREIVSSGIWRTLQATGELLLSGLDLLISNLLIGPNMMGVLALSKTIPTLVNQLNWTIPTAFAPQVTINYAKNSQEEILREMRYACKACACIGTIPLGGFIVFGQDFFKLWQPTQDAAMLA